MQTINIIHNAVQFVKECQKICWVPLDQMLVNTKPLQVAVIQVFHFYWIFAWIPILVKSFPPLYWGRTHIWHCISLRYQAWRFGTCMYHEVMPGARLVCAVASMGTEEESAKSVLLTSIFFQGLSDVNFCLYCVYLSMSRAKMICTSESVHLAPVKGLV